MTDRAALAVVIGASSGIGAATVRSLSETGWTVLAVGRRQERLIALAKGHPAIIPCDADATQADDVARIVAAADDTGLPVRRLIYTAGTNIPDRALVDLTPARWEELLRTNLTGAFLCTQGFRTALCEAGDGLVVYVATGAVLRPDVSGAAYQASKHGLVGLAGAVRMECAAQGLRTTVVYPGLCDTEILKQRPTPTPNAVLSQALHPDDVAAAITFVVNQPARVHIPDLPIVPAALWIP